MIEDDLYSTVAAFFFIFLVIGGLILAVMQPHFEAKTFNKFSDKKATYWDAVFGNLRITP